MNNEGGTGEREQKEREGLLETTRDPFGALYKQERFTTQADSHTLSGQSLDSAG